MINFGWAYRLHKISPLDKCFNSKLSSLLNSVMFLVTSTLPLLPILNPKKLEAFGV